MNDNLLINLDLERSKISFPSYIAVEGPIGVGKTTLAKRLAKSFNYDVLLEEPETNPFLERFYRDRRTHALPVQLHFLFQRIQKLQNLRQGDIFQQVQISDFKHQLQLYLKDCSVVVTKLRNQWKSLICNNLMMHTLNFSTTTMILLC